MISTHRFNPLYSLAIINLPETKLSIQTNQLTHILAGALLAHSQAGVRLVGERTSEGGSLSVGFAVTGSDAKLPTETPLALDEDFQLVSKPVGTGVIMAANRQLRLMQFVLMMPLLVCLCINTRQMFLKKTI